MISTPKDYNYSYLEILRAIQPSKSSRYSKSTYGCADSAHKLQDVLIEFVCKRGYLRIVIADETILIHT
jgi:hypothetical protein